MDDIDPQLLRVLRAVADGGSITRAATALGSSQPAVSQLLTRAEQRLGHALVLRGGRGATLTHAGQVLADHALHVQAALTAAREDLDAVGGLTRGRVRLAGFPSASSTLVPAVLARLASTAAGVATSYVEVEPPEALDLVRSGEVDVALTFTHVGDDTGVDAALLSRPLGRDPLALVTPRTGAASGAGPTSGAGPAAAPGRPLRRRLPRRARSTWRRSATRAGSAGARAAGATCSRRAPPRASRRTSSSRPTTPRPWSDSSPRGSGWRCSPGWHS